jgi:putative transcriptional regulator
MARRRFLLFWLLAALSPLAAAAPVQSASILLVASSGIKDPRFAQTVIVVTRHGRSPPIGVIVNRPTAATVGQLFPKLPEGELSRPLLYGGPVATDQVTFLFRSRQGSDDAIAVAPNVHLGRSGATLRKLLRGEHPHHGLMVIIGYAGWAFGQLEKEIERGDWFVLPMDEKAVFEHPADTMWRDLHRRASITTVSNPHPTLHTTPDT